MNWKLILQLSLFGLIMAFGTVSMIPTTFEPVFWVVIYVLSAYIIAKGCTQKYFMNGFMVAIFNCVWITAVHAYFYSAYIKNHPYMSPQKLGLPLSMYTHPREALIITAPGFAIGCGIVLGLFAFVASKIVKKKNVSAAGVQ